MSDNKDADVVMVDKAAEPAAEGTDQLYRLEILATIKQQQQQNGLRHGDYQRYRQYCSRRLRRLRQSVKFTHARHHFKPKAIETRHITDPKFLAIPLINAERSWSYAMQLKNDLTTDTPRKRFHLLKRLKRAAQWSRDLERLCAVKADTRTRVEAEGYAAWMQGSELLERDAHEEALKKFLHAQAVYGELGKLSGPEVQSMCEERVQQLEQMINFCKYHVNKKSKGGNQDSKQLIDSLRAGVNDQLASKLETLLSETRKQQASALETIQWQGRTVPISNDKLRLAFVEAKELASNLKHVEMKDVKEDEGDAKLQTYQAIFAAYDTALQTIRDDLADIKTQATKADLLALQAYANLKKQKFSSSRNVHLAIGLQRRLKEQDSLGYKGKKVKPDEIVTLYEKAIQNQNDILEVAKANNDTDLITESTGRCSAFSALRVLYLAESYRRLGRSSESLALYTRAITLANDALKIVKEEALITLLQDAINDAKAAQLIAHATGILEADAPTKEITQSVAKLALDERKTNAVLADNLDSYVATPDALVEFPPPFVATACKPILFDLALNSFTLPDLSARIAALPAAKAPPAKPKATPAKPEQKEQKQQQKTPAKPTQQQGKQQQAQAKGKQGQAQQTEQEQGKGGGWFGRLLGR